MELQTENSRLNQERKQANPIEKYRRPTDEYCIFVFFLVLIIWLATSIVGLCLHRNYRIEYDFSLINAPLTEFNFTFPVSIYLSLVSGFLCLFLYEKQTKVFVYLFFVMYILGSFSYFIKLMITENLERIFKFSFNTNISITLTWVCNLPLMIFAIASILSFLNIDKSLLCDIIKNCCRLILRSPSLLFFSALISIPILLVVTFSLNALIAIAYTNVSWNLQYFLFTVIILSGLLTIQVLSNFALMVISEYAINHYWRKDDNASIVQSALKILRNHVGTVTFASTPFIPLISSIILALMHKPTWKHKDHYFFYIMSKAYLMLWTSEFPLIISSIYGTGFLKSYQKTYDTVTRRPTLYMSMLLMIYAAFEIILIVAMISISISIAAVYLILIRSGSNEEQRTGTKTLIIIVCGFSYPVLLFALVIFSTMKAQLTNKIIILNKKDEDDEEEVNVLKVV